MAATLFTHISCTFGHFSSEIGGCFFGKNNYRAGPVCSRKDRSERGRHHAKGTRYVGEIGFMAAMLWASAAIQSKVDDISGSPAGASYIDTPHKLPTLTAPSRDSLSQ